MTKPTGRPRGRPKTKEYVTLMARFPQDLADRVERYAGRKRQTVSDVLRDGVLVLLQDDDPYRPFVSDMNAASDILSDAKREAEEEVPPDAQSVIVSDTKEALPDNVSDGTGEIAPAAGMAEASADILPDVQAAQPVIASDTKKARQRKRAKRDHVSDTNAESEKASDRKGDTSSLASDPHEDASHVPAQPMQPPEPEPADRDSIEWRRWAVLEQVRTAQAPATPGDIARQIGSTSALVRHDLEHWRQQGRVQRDAQGGYVCSSGVLARVADTLADDRRPSVGPRARQTPSAPGQTAGQTAPRSPRAESRQHRGTAKKRVRQEREGK